MQATTGCKINVSPASGQDFERDIGLVGSRDSIERAKEAITEKVRAVVSISLLPFPACHLFFRSRKRTGQVADRSAESSTRTKPNIHRNNSSFTDSRTHRPKLPIPTHTQLTAVTRIMLPFGTLAYKQIKVNKCLKPKVPQARDDLCVIPFDPI